MPRESIALNVNKGEIQHEDRHPHDHPFDQPGLGGRHLHRNPRLRIRRRRQQDHCRFPGQRQRRHLRQHRPVDAGGHRRIQGGRRDRAFLRPDAEAGAGAEVQRVQRAQAGSHQGRRHQSRTHRADRSHRGARAGRNVRRERHRPVRHRPQPGDQ